VVLIGCEKSLTVLPVFFAHSLVCRLQNSKSAPLVPQAMVTVTAWAGTIAAMKIVAAGTNAPINFCRKNVRCDCFFTCMLIAIAPRSDLYSYLMVDAIVLILPFRAYCEAFLNVGHTNFYINIITAIH
jgi:hypothetical protein